MKLWRVLFGCALGAFAIWILTTVSSAQLKNLSPGLTVAFILLCAEIIWEFRVSSVVISRNLNEISINFKSILSGEKTKVYVLSGVESILTSWQTFVNGITFTTLLLKTGVRDVYKIKCNFAMSAQVLANLDQELHKPKQWN